MEKREIENAIKHFKNSGYKVKKSNDYWVVGGVTYSKEELIALMNEQKNFTFFKK